MPAHHRHVASVVEDAILLLVGEVVLLVDDDQAELPERQEQRRAGAADDPDAAVGDAAPDPLAHPRRDFRMPFRRPRAEAAGEAIEEIGVSAISGSRISTCRPAASAAATASK